MKPAPAAPSPTPESQDIGEIYRDGMNAFGTGNYAKAIDRLKVVLAQAAPDSPQLESVRFTLGAAYFNSKDYPGAIAAFTDYQKRYPKNPRITEVTFAMGQALLLSGQLDAAKAIFKQLENVPGIRDQALLFQAAAGRQAGKPDEAIASLERLTSPEIKNTLEAKGGAQLVSLYLEKGDTEKAAKALQKLERAERFVENIVGLNALMLQVGDKMLEQQNDLGALECFRRVRLKGDIIASQKARIADMEARVQANLAENLRDPSKALRNVAANAQISADIESAKEQLAEFEKMPSVLGPLYLRMARCFESLSQPWEAIVVYEELLDRVKAGPEREAAAYALVIAYAEVNQAKSALAACERYLKEFPTASNAESVRYLRGTMALQDQDFSKGEGWLLELLEQKPKDELAQQIRILLGNAKFSQGHFDEAIEQYQKYLQAYPKGPDVEDAQYRSALALLFAGKFEEAVPALEQYVSDHPKGDFVPDAKYRLAVCLYAAQQYDKVIEACLAWEKKFPNNDLLGEVAALLGDAYAAVDNNQDALKAYQLSAQHAATEEVLNYSLFEAAKLLQKESRWAEVSAMFEDFVNKHPEHPTTLAALFWIGKAKAREGKVDEAKQFLADNIKNYINDPTREPVDQMLTQLAQLCAKKRAPAPAPESTPAPAASPAAAGQTSPAPTPPPTPTPTPAPTPDPGAQLDALLAFAKDSPTARARVLFARAEVARLRKRTDEEQALMAKIAEFKPEDLSPSLLGLIGDNLLAAGQLDRAAAFYTYLRDYYPKSPYLDYAYAGLGQIALQKKEYPLALKYFTDGLEKISPAVKIKDLTLGQAETLLAMGRIDEAQKLFEQVASTREWRGEATAQSIYALGEIQWKRSKWAEANAYYQRLFVTYRKFLPWVAKAYLKSAECLVKLGKTTDAINTYNEMLRNEKLATFPEAQIARKRLQELGNR